MMEKNEISVTWPSAEQINVFVVTAFIRLTTSAAIVVGALTIMDTEVVILALLTVVLATQIPFEIETEI